MASNTQSGHDPAELGELERDILSIVWRLGAVTAEQVREELDRPLKDSTVRTVLRRLEEKGYLAHSVENRTFLYRPAESRQLVAGRAVKRIVDWFCEGSVEELLVGMVDSKVLDRAELRRLAARIAEARQHEGRSAPRRPQQSKGGPQMTVAPMIPDPGFYGPAIQGHMFSSLTTSRPMISAHFIFSQIISALPQAALRSLALAIGVWAILRLFRVRNVLALKCAWTLVLATAFLMPLLLPIASRLPRATLVLPAFMHRTAPATSASGSEETAPSQTPEPPTPQHSARSATPTKSRAHRSVAPEAVPGEHSVPSVPEAPPPQAPALPTFSVFAAIALLYLAVSGLFLVRLVYGLMRALLLWRSAQPVSAELAAAHGLRLRASAAVSSPVTIGSSVILPADYRSWDSEKLRIVLAHERSHVRQGDFYLQALAGLYTAIVWFSPLGWWLKRQLSDLAEAISDRSGLEQAASRASYAQILLEFAAAPHLTEIGVAMARSSNLSHRIERLFNDSAFRQAFTASRRTLATALLVPVVLFAAATFVRVTAAAQTPEQTTSAQRVTMRFVTLLHSAYCSGWEILRRPSCAGSGGSSLLRSVICSQRVGIFLRKRTGGIAQALGEKKHFAL